MIISDLNHIENIEDANIEGGIGLNFAEALSQAQAIGILSKTVNLTETATVAGLFSRGTSFSSSFSAS